MRLDSLFYRLAYRFGSPRWDTGQPHPQLRELVLKRPPGRALDLGSGSGADAIYLAQQGWQVTGIDFVPRAIEAARTRASGAGVSPEFVVGDVSRLRQSGVSGPFDLLIDVGCYHGLPSALRDSYAAEAAAVARPGADLYLAGISQAPPTWRLLGAQGITAAELRRPFGAAFDLVDEHAVGPIGRASHFVLFHLVRRGSGEGGSRNDNGAR